MINIASEQDFEALLQEEQAVVFVFFDWSGQAVTSLQLFELWEREWKAAHANTRIKFYRLDPDRNPFAQQWLGGNAKGDDGVEGGFGSVTWLRQGQSVGFVRFAAKAGKDTLTRLTEECFGSLATNN